MPEFDLVAHRGYPLRYPENTLPGIEAAIKAGARYVEVDVQLTRDKIAVLYHDRDMLRLSNQPGAIHDYDMAQLALFHVTESGRFGDEFNSMPIARLSELADVIADNPAVIFFIELKRNSLEHFGDQQVLNVVTTTLQQVASQCVFISYSLSVLSLLRAQTPHAIGVVIDDWKEHAQQAIAELHPEYLFFDIESLPAQPVVFATSKLAVFECTDPQQALAAADRGVGLVETFAIAEMRQQLGFD